MAAPDGIAARHQALDPRLAGAAWAAPRSTCSIRTTRRIRPPIARSPASSMAAVRMCASGRKRCWALPDGVCCGRLGLHPDVCHLNEGHAAFAVLERARAWMVDNQPAVRRGARRHARRQSLHHAYRGGRRLRSICAGADDEVFRVLRGTPARHPDDGPAGARPARSERQRRAFQHGVSGDARQRRRQWREPAARRGQPPTVSAALSALAAARGAGAACHQRRPHSHLGIARSATRVDRSLRPGPVAGRDAKRRAMLSPDERHAPVAIPHGYRPAPDRVRAQAPGPPARGAGRHGGRSGGSGAHFRSGHPDAGLCAAVCDIQTAEPAAARSGPAGAHPHQSAIARCN